MYPRLVIDTGKFIHNLKTLRNKLDEHNITFTFVTKAFCAMPELTRLADDYVDFFGDSRIGNIKKMVHLSKPKILIRIPMPSETAEVVKYADISLNSEAETVALLNKAAEREGTVHQIILMIDLGDLREGYFDPEDFFDAVLTISKMKNIEIYGVGVNLTCFGALLPTREIMETLLFYAKRAEELSGKEMKKISGGNSSSLYLLYSGEMPSGVNNLRLGEGVICGRDTAYGEMLPDMYNDVFTLEAEIIELKEKPSVPLGKTGLNSFGQTPVYIDRGVRKRAILAVGEQDIYQNGVTPFDERLIVLGASSDHLILDVHGAAGEYAVGSAIGFNLDYPSILKACTSPYVEKFFLT